MIILDCRFTLIAKIPIAECPIAEIPIAECPIAEIPIAECPIAKIPIAECPIAKIPIAECLIAECPIAQLQSTQIFDVQFFHTKTHSLFIFLNSILCQLSFYVS